MGILNPTRLGSGVASEAREYRATGVELRYPAPGSKPRAIYLDANATAPPLKPVVDAVRDAMLSEAGNPASWRFLCHPLHDSSRIRRRGWPRRFS